MDVADSLTSRHSSFIEFPV